MKVWRAIAMAISAYCIGALLYVFCSRFAYPYDLEWMEGGVLCHALRLVEGNPIYAPPSVDFISFPYTPGYPAALFVLSKLFGLGYPLGRALSLVGFFTVALLGYVYARREGGSRTAAVAGVALICAAFAPTGAWYDLGRPDSLFMGITIAGLCLGWWRRHSLGGGVAAALLLIAAFFVKQTAAPFMLALGLALLWVAPRVAIAYAATLGLVGLSALWLCNRGSDGWFWTYVSVLHRNHDFYPVRAFLTAPARLALILGPALVLVPWALVRARSPGLVYAAFIALTGIAAACIGFGTQWAFVNAFFPGIMLPAIAVAVSAGRLMHANAAPQSRQAVVWALLALSLLGAPGGLQRAAAAVLPLSWGLEPLLRPTGYDPRRFIPTERDRALGDALVARLRAAPGDVLVPFHPFYAHLAGKRIHLHLMGMRDIWRAGLGTPRGLSEAFIAHQFSLVILDDIIEHNWSVLPGLLPSYRIAERIEGPRVVAGAATEPRFVLVPNAIGKESQ